MINPKIMAALKTVQNNRRGSVASGNKWEVIKEFKGKSHANGGINLEVGNGYVRKIDGNNEADDIAKNGRFWKNLGAGAYGAGEGILDTVSMGATDQLTDAGYNALQNVGNNSEDEMREQNSIRGYATAAGAITGGVLTGGGATGTAIQQTAKGLGAGISEGSKDSKLAQQVGTYLPMAGNIAAVAYGGGGFQGGVSKAKSISESQKIAQDILKSAANKKETAAPKQTAPVNQPQTATMFSPVGKKSFEQNKYSI